MPERQVFEELSGQEMFADYPLSILVPFLVTAAWMTALVGLIWLAFVDYRVALGVTVSGTAALWLWRRNAPSRRELQTRKP